jgi:hypothetical protein
MSLLIFVAKVLFSGFWTHRSSSSTRFALRLQQWRVLSLLGRGTVRPHDLIVVEKLGMAIADGVQFVSARNGFEIRLKDDVAPADVDGYKVARLQLIFAANAIRRWEARMDAVIVWWSPLCSS